jgi:HEAT repeat protein
LLERLEKLLVEDDDADVRAAAAAALQSFAQRAELGELTDEQAARLRQTLLETIHRPGERQDVRAEALATIGYFSDPTVSRELGAAFHDEATRLYSLRGMGHSADPTWVDTILEQVEHPDDPIREAAAAALGEIGEERAVPALTDLIDDPALPVRLAAIAALGEIGGGEAREALVYALEDKDESIRDAAEAALEALDFFDDPLAP